MVAGPSIVFKRKTVVDETHIFNSTNACKRIVGIDADHFALTECVNVCLQDSTQNLSLMQICKDLGPIRKILGVSRIRSYHALNEWDPIVEMRASRQQELGSVDIATQFLSKSLFYQYCPCPEARPILTERENQHGTKERKIDEMRQQHIEE